MDKQRSTPVRQLTASLRALPDFLIIGAQRSGTTSLYEYLVQHPAIVPARKKEVTFFNHSERLKLGLNWYRSFFPLQSFKLSRRDGSTPVTGEATPEYLFFPHVAERVARVLPNAKLIVILRDPVTRAYSEYEINVRKGREELSFEEALEKEAERTASEFQRMRSDENYYSRNCHLYSYRQRGHYAEQLDGWLSCFPREQFHILKSEDMFSNPEETYNSVIAFLGLSPFYDAKFEKHNSAHRSKMKPETATQLREYYRPHNAKLYEMINRNMHWDASTL